MPAERRIVAIDVADRRTPSPSSSPWIPAVAPPGVLPPQAEDQAPGVGVNRGPTGPSVRLRPLPGNQLSVPPEERVGPDHERAPRLPWEQPARRG